MNEQLQGKLLEILTSIQGAAKTAGDFAIEQLPEIVQSYVAYGRIVSLVNVGLALALWVACCYALYRTIKYCRQFDDLLDGSPVIVVFGSFVGGFGSLFGAVIVKDTATTAVLVWLAPKIWLLKELAGMLK